ncbi:hypothetical protein Pint_18980 [Pistacia integerrima]|uniref:Uncharacterized protein n=1 Tax=Pistacia integerrima TaxID=434235 RepID=A0ACC0YTX9_9ROSI|nr:hypothetical protein Pint_18980 [Pistacia integerrima]
MPQQVVITFCKVSAKDFRDFSKSSLVVPHFSNHSYVYILLICLSCNYQCFIFKTHNGEHLQYSMLKSEQFSLYSTSPSSSATLPTASMVTHLILIMQQKTYFSLVARLTASSQKIKHGHGLEIIALNTSPSLKPNITLR